MAKTHEDIKILSKTRVSHQQDMMKRGLQMRFEVDKQEDGTFIAKVSGKDIKADGRTEEHAIQALKKIIQEDHMNKGGQDLV